MTPQKVQDAIIYITETKNIDYEHSFSLSQLCSSYYVLEKIINMVEI